MADDDDIKRLHQLGTQLKQTNPPRKIKKDPKKRQNFIPDRAKNNIFNFSKRFFRICKQKKSMLDVMFSYHLSTLLIKWKKQQFQNKKIKKSSSIRLIERKYQIFDRTILIRQRKRVYYPEVNHNFQHQSILDAEETIASSSSGLFDMPVSDD